MIEILSSAKNLIPLKYRKLVLPTYRKYLMLPTALVWYRTKFSKKKRKRILFVYCNYIQDKLSYDLVKPKLTDYEFETSWWWNTSIVKAYKPDLMVISETISPQTKELCKITRQSSPNTQILNLHGEGSFSPRVEAYWCSGKDEDWEIAWGETAKKARIKYGANPDRIFVCGCPRFDRYPNKQYMSKHEFEKIVGSNGRKIVLFATNFLVGSPDLSKFFKWDNNKYYRLKIDVTTAVLNIAKMHPELFFLIKLHPSEYDDIYTKMAQERGLANYKVLGRKIHQEEMYSYDIIPNIDVLVHWASTISTEAWMCNKPTISTLFHDFEDATPELVRGSQVVTNEDELEKAILKLLESPLMDPDIVDYRQDFIRRWFYKLDGASTDRVKAVIDGILKKAISV